MANLKLNRWLIGIFVSIIVIFAMSDNVSAFEMVMDYDNYESISYSARVNVDCIISGITYTNQGFCSNIDRTGDLNLTRLVSNSIFSVKSGDIVNFKVAVFSLNNFSFNSGTLYINNQVQSGRVIGFNEVSNDDLADTYSLDLDSGSISSGNYISRVYEYYIRVSTSSDSYQVGLNSSSANYPIFSWYSSNLTDRLIFKIFDVNVFRYVGTDTNAEQKQATEDAVEGSENAGNSSSSSAESGSASLLNVIGAFAGIITSAQPTNCMINGNMGNLNIGQIDLCANPVPSFVQIIGSIILVCLVIPFVVIMFNRFISIFRSFQS